MLPSMTRDFAFIASPARRARDRRREPIGPAVARARISAAFLHAFASNRIVKMPQSLDKRKVAAVGLLVVGESEKYTCFLQEKELAEILQTHNGKLQDAVNSATDIVIVGSWAREKEDFKDSAKAVGLQTEKDLQASGTRKKPLQVFSLKEFCETFDVKEEVLEESCTAQFDKDAPPYHRPQYIAPGPKRTRSWLFPSTLQWVKPASITGRCKGLVIEYLSPAELFPAE
jgi:hypothetical protein